MTTDLILGELTVRSDEGGRLHFWGEVYNLGLITQRSVRLTIRLLDAKEQPLAEQTEMLALEWTLPGKRNPFHILFEEPPAGWKSYDMRLAGRLHVYEDEQVPQPYLDLAVNNTVLHPVGRGGLVCELSGQVVNTGTEPAELVQVVAALYGTNGTVVSVENPLLTADSVLPPGEAVRFGVKFYACGEPPERFIAQAQGRRAKRRPPEAAGA